MASSSSVVEVYPGRTAVIEFDPSLTFECVDTCTWCCHHGVLLYDSDLLELAKRANLDQTTTRFRGRPFVTTEEKERDTAVDAEGRACAFLTEDGLCELQSEAGWKPTRCSIFPLGVWREDDELHVDIRDSAHRHCDGLNVSDRRVIDNLEAFLPEVLWELDDPSTDHVL